MSVMSEEEMREAYRDADAPMVFVRRPGPPLGSGPIMCAWSLFNPEATEILPASHPDVVQFYADLGVSAS